MNSIKQYQQHFEQVLKALLDTLDTPAEPLQQAICYMTLNSGKRIRPLLIYTCGESLGATLQQLDTAAIAVELIHTYSLIHDDLPAMDDDDDLFCVSMVQWLKTKNMNVFFPILLVKKIHLLFLRSLN